MPFLFTIALAACRREPSTDDAVAPGDTAATTGDTAAPTLPTPTDSAPPGETAPTGDTGPPAPADPVEAELVLLAPSSPGDPALVAAAFEREQPDGGTKGTVDHGDCDFVPDVVVVQPPFEPRDAGAVTLALDGDPVALAGTTPGRYAAELPSWPAGAAVSVTGTGTAEVPPFDVPGLLVIPELVTAVDPPARIDRTQDLAIAWTGAGAEVLLVIDVANAGRVECTFADVGSGTVPAVALAQLDDGAATVTLSRFDEGTHAQDGLTLRGTAIAAVTWQATVE